MAVRIAYFLTHPIQYQSPMIRRLVESGVSLHVIYGCDPSASDMADPGFQRPIHWDVPMYEGYSHEFLLERPAQGSKLRSFARIKSLAVQALERGHFDLAWIHGWGDAHPAAPFFSVAAMLAAWQLRLPVLMRGETHLTSLRGGSVRRRMHQVLLRRLFRHVVAFLAVGSANARLYREYGVAEARIFSMPNTVDNTFFQEKCTLASQRRTAFKQELGLPPDRPVILYCGRLIAEKSLPTLIAAVNQLQQEPTGTAPMLLIVGEGPLRKGLEASSGANADHIRFLGFRNQTELPQFYNLCDVFVLPSVFEPWGLVVNEAMNAGRPVIVSDRVGCAADLVKPQVNGGIFPAGDAGALANVLRPFLADAGKREHAGRESLAIINRWSFEEDLNGLRQALAFLASRQIKK